VISGKTAKKLHLQDLMSWGRNFRGTTPGSLICRHINLFKYGIAGNAYTLAL
jgi:hypothetical protein